MQEKLSHPAYKPPLCFVLRLRMQKGGGVFAGHYGINIKCMMDALNSDIPVCVYRLHFVDWLEGSSVMIRFWRWRMIGLNFT